MNLTTLYTSLGVTVFVVLLWLGGIAYVRQKRFVAESRPTGQATADLDHTRAVVDAIDPILTPGGDIESWIARAEALPDGKEPQPPGPLDRAEERLLTVAARHFPKLNDPHPHIHLLGVTGVEKRLLAWVSRETGLPNPFEALDAITGDPDELRRAVDAWDDAHTDISAAIDRLCAGAESLRARWEGPHAEQFLAVLADYLGELDALADDVKSTFEAIRGLQAEAALAEATVVGLVNLLIGSLCGYVVESVLTAGAMTPAVAAQAQLELTWVLKQIARALRRLPAIYANTRHVLQSVTGFKDLESARDRFRVGELAQIERVVDRELA